MIVENICCQGSVPGYEFYFRSKVQHTNRCGKFEKTYFIRPEDISLIRTEGREIACYDRQGDRYLLHKPLYELENMLDPSFVRISKSAIANIRQIGHVEAGFNGTMELVMKNGTIDYISRSFRKNFKERLGLT